MRDRRYSPQSNVKKNRISQSRIDDVRSKARQAKELRANTYLRTYCETAKQEILGIHARQSLQDSEETRETTNGRRTVKYPSVKEYTLLAGQYRFIEQLYEDMEQAIILAKQLEEQIKAGELEIVVEDDNNE